MDNIMQKLRRKYHKNICNEILYVDSHGIPCNADKSSVISISISKGILKEIGFKVIEKKLPGQTTGKIFEIITKQYIADTFEYLNHLRPGKWLFEIGKKIEYFEQYEHLEDIAKVLKNNKELRATLGDYVISPDIVIGRCPVDDSKINEKNKLLTNNKIVNLTPIRLKNSTKPILHASISCKWTIRSDRAQNARTESLNLIRNRKGKTPHICIVTAEPYPQRIASLALGTGDIDCVYHFALNELKETINKINNTAVLDMLDMLIIGKRLRDISDLPFDLAI